MPTAYSCSAIQGGVWFPPPKKTVNINRYQKEAQNVSLSMGFFSIFFPLKFRQWQLLPLGRPLFSDRSDPLGEERGDEPPSVPAITSRRATQ